MVENWMRKISSDSGLISLFCAVEKNIHFNLGDVQSKKWRKSECGGEFKENSCYFHRTSTVNEESEWILCVFFAAAQPIFPLSHTSFPLRRLSRALHTIYSTMMRRSRCSSHVFEALCFSVYSTTIMRHTRKNNTQKNSMCVDRPALLHDIIISSCTHQLCRSSHFSVFSDLISSFRCFFLPLILVWIN